MATGEVERAGYFGLPGSVVAGLILGIVLVGSGLAIASAEWPARNGQFFAGCAMAAGGAIFFVAVGMNARRGIRADVGLAGDPEGWKVVQRALRTGEAPSDPALHPPIRVLLARQRQLLDRNGKTLFGISPSWGLVALAVLQVVAGLFGGSWFNWFTAAWMLALAVGAPLSIRRQRRRLDRLEADLAPRA